MNKRHLPALALGLSCLAYSACKKTDSATPDAPTTTGSTSITSVVQAKYTSAVTISTSGSSITLKSNGTPDHPTPYYATTSPLWEAQRAGYSLNPGTVGVQNYSMTIPTNPEAAATKEATALGPIGMALNGVAIYNDQEGGNKALDTGVIGSFDRAGAHPGPGNTYHYHVNGDFTTKDDANLVGFLRDGFPLYGRKDQDGTYPANLDAYGGHTGTTADFASGIYHYHCSNVNYLNTGVYVLKSGSYYGTKGTFTF